MEAIKLIIVDDEAAARDIIIEGINWKENNLEVYSAADGKEALELIAEKNIQIVLTDIKMPVMDGLELIRRANELGEDIVSIVMSSYNEFDLVRSAMRLGAYDYIFKPTALPQDILKIVLETIAKLKIKVGGSQKNLISAFLNNQSQSEIFRILASSSSLQEDKKEELIEKLQMKGALPVYGVRMILSQYQEKLKKNFLGDYEIMRFTIENIINEVFDNNFGYEIQTRNFYDYNFIIWENGSSNSQDVLLNRMQSAMEKLNYYFTTYYNMRCFIGISEKRTSFACLFEQFIQAEEAVQRAKILNWPLLHYRFTAKEEISEKIVDAVRYMEDNLCSKELSLQSVAEYIGISKNYFSKIFKNQMGINFVDYINKKKLEKAKELYLSTDKKIYEIAEDLGYSDWHYLYTLYKKEYGHSLSQERP